MDFASFELGDCAQKLVYPIFGWKPFCKESADEANMKLREFMKALDQQVKGKRYAFGEELTLADIALFRQLKFFFQLVFPKGLREKVFPNVNDWFLRVLNTPETDKVYGKVLLCNQPVKAYICEKPKEAPKEQPKKIDIEKALPRKSVVPKESNIAPKAPRMSVGFLSLRDTLMKNMLSREKPEKPSVPTEPIKVIKSDAMKNMVAAMNKHYEESHDTIDEPVKIISGEGGPGVPPPPPPPPPLSQAGNINTISISSSVSTNVSVSEPPKIGVPPPPPPPPPPCFDPSKIPKKPKKPVVKKKAPPPPPPKPAAPSMKDLIMNVTLKKVGK